MKSMMNRRVIIGCLVFFFGLMAGSKNVLGAEAPADFFRGKTIVWIFSGSAGTPGDLMTRIIAPFLGKEIGAKVKVENRNTDEGVNYVYNQGTREGLTLCTKSGNSIIGNEILKAPGVQYETDKFNYVSDVHPATSMFQLSPKCPYKTLDALRKAKGLRAGGTSAKGALAVGSAVMMEILGLDGKVITGFTDILEANDSALLASALGDIARARGMSEVARASGLTREALYKALRPNAKPRYDTIAKICGALGVRLVAQAIHV